MWTIIVRVFTQIGLFLWAWLQKDGIALAVNLVVSSGLLDIAKEVVARIAEDPELLTDEDKREKAVEEIKALARERLADFGAVAKDSLVNLALELAMQWLKKGGK